MGVETRLDGGTSTGTNAKEMTAHAAALRQSRLKIATAQEIAHISPWAQLGHKKYLIETKEIDGLVPDRIWEKIEEYGICLIRLLNYPPEGSVLENIVKLIGFPAEEQNDYLGPIKDITPGQAGRANSGDTTSELGFHVDGTQDLIQPAILVFNMCAALGSAQTADLPTWRGYWQILKRAYGMKS